jgi:recombination protein RecT
MATTLATAVNGNGQKTPPELAAKIQMIRALTGELDNAIPPAVKKVLTPDRMMRLVLTAMRQVRNLDQCTFPSLAGALMVSAQLGLEPCTPLGHCYIIPRRNGKTGQYEATFQLGYQGMLELAYRTETIKSVTAKAVHANDEFIYEEGLDDKLVHRPFLAGDRGPVIAYYAVIKFVNGGHAFDVMTFSDMANHVERFAPRDYKTQKITGPWSTDFDEMAKKTMIRRLFKMMRKSTDIVAKATLYDERVVDRDQATSELRPQFDPPPPVAQIPARPASDPVYDDIDAEVIEETEPEPEPVKEEAPAPKAVKAAPKKKAATAPAKAAEPEPKKEASQLAATVAELEVWFDQTCQENDEAGLPGLADREELMGLIWEKLASNGQVSPDTKHWYSRLNEIAKIAGDAAGSIRILDAGLEAVRTDYMGEPGDSDAPEAEPEKADPAVKPEATGAKVAQLDKLFDEWASAFDDASVSSYAMPSNVVDQVYFRAMKAGLVSANARDYRAKTKDLATIGESFADVHAAIHPILEAMWADFVKPEPGSDG